MNNIILILELIKAKMLEINEKIEKNEGDVSELKSKYKSLNDLVCVLEERK